MTGLSKVRSHWLNWRVARWAALAATIPVLWACNARRLEKPRAGITPRQAVEGVVLAVDAAVRSLGTRDAQSVAKRLGDVAEEAAEGFKEAREELPRFGLLRIAEHLLR